MPKVRKSIRISKTVVWAILWNNVVQDNQSTSKRKKEDFRAEWRVILILEKKEIWNCDETNSH